MPSVQGRIVGVKCRMPLDYPNPELRSGLTTWGCSSGYYNGNEVYMKFDTTEMGTLAAWQRKNIAIHELGHAYGLDDASALVCRVMNAGMALEGCALFPASDDISGVNAIY